MDLKLGQERVTGQQFRSIPVGIRVAQQKHGGIVSCVGSYAQDLRQGMDWREVMSWYPTERIIYEETSLARDKVQLEPWDMGDDGWPWWHRDLGGFVCGRMSQRLVWVLGSSTLR